MIRHDPDRQRFELDLEAGTAFVQYELRDDALDLLSTWVPPDHRNRGIGGRVVVAALEHARAEGMLVIPTCPFVPGVIARNPEFASLIRDASGADRETES